jgi:ABC-type multidrug transport system fused ATPase/permease subunit
MIFLFLSSIASAAFPGLMGRLFGSSAEEQTIDLGLDAFFQLDSLNLNQIAQLLLTIFIFQAIFSFCRIYFFSIVTEGALKDIRKTAFEKLVSSPIQFFNENKVGELTSRVATDINQLQETFNSTLAEFIRQVIIVIAMVSGICMISSPLALRMLSVVPPVVIVAVLFGKYIKNLSKDAQDAAADSNSILEEAMTGIVNVKSFTNEIFEVKRYTKAILEIRRLSLKSALGRGVFVSFIILCMFGSVVFVIWSGMNMVEAGELEKGEFFSFIMSTVFLAASIGSLPNLYASLQKSMGASEHLMSLLDGESEEVLIDVTGKKLKGSIKVDNVSFSYPSRKEIEVLNNVSFDVNEGETIALVGSSGSGKSTIASLLLQFYPISQGKILFDGENANNFDLKDIRSNMAFVPQEVILFGGTIKENIAYGRPNATDEEIRDAAKSANALRFVDEFPDGFETVVGDRGIQLSGGQRQRIAIARAILKDPKILILDEATSALDTESEHLVQEALDKLMMGRTSIVIAHRLSTIRNADKIMVLNKGKIVESGKHEELIKIEDGQYLQLNHGQFS